MQKAGGIIQLRFQNRRFCLRALDSSLFILAVELAATALACAADIPPLNCYPAELVATKREPVADRPRLVNLSLKHGRIELSYDPGLLYCPN